MEKKLQCNSGFSALELLAVLTILMILTQMGYLYFNDLAKSARDAVAKSDAKNLVTVIGAVFADEQANNFNSANSLDPVTVIGDPVVFKLSPEVRAVVKLGSEKIPNQPSYFDAEFYNIMGSGKRFQIIIDEISGTTTLLFDD